LAQPPGGAERRLVAVPTIKANNDTQEGIATQMAEEYRYLL
jgi:hypothetical protein